MKLTRIKSSVQKISEAISSVIRVDVTVVDCKLNRIAGTGRYNKRIGEKVSQNSVFGFALKQGESFIIENPSKHIACLKCESTSNCKEHAEVCCPIKVDDRVVGVIGLIAFNDEQKLAIIENQSNLLKFLNRMAELISSKMLEQANTDRIELLVRELEIVLDSVDRGIIAWDNNGELLHYNKKALKLLQLDKEEISELKVNEILGGINIDCLINSKCNIRNREFVCDYKNIHFRGIFDASSISIGNKNLGLVLTFSNITEVLNIVNNVTTGGIVTKFENIIGNSYCLNKVKDEAMSASKSTSTVLIQGESGTGKELFARAIHFHSFRAKGPFIPLNCAAIPDQLLESELFGYEDGAFTGARRGGKSGKFELANGGTIFLDEIGDMPIHLQSKLLRVLQERVIERIGGKDFIPIDVRIIAATNKELEKRVSDGEFRQDLFYRLNVIPLNIPPLRNRKQDIVALVDYLLVKCNEKLDKNIKNISEKVLETLTNYNWPGNVRELENVIEYAVSMCSGDEINEAHLPNRIKKSEYLVKDSDTDKIVTIKELERNEIYKALKYFGNSKRAIESSCEALGISRATLYRKIKEYNLDIQ